MSTLAMLLNSLISIYVMALLMRVWMQWVRADFYNPFSQFIVKATQPLVKPLRRFVPAIGAIDTASVLLAFIILAIKLPVLNALLGGSFIISFDLIFFGIAGVLKAAGKLLFYVLLIRAVMSWFSRGQNPIDYLLHQLTEPLMAPIRRILPPFGGLDFSVMVIIFALYILNNFGYEYVKYWHML